jgi:UDP-3-O-[3-hydroxymyristoyl] glucosamine N-acyltransferase
LSDIHLSLFKKLQIDLIHIDDTTEIDDSDEYIVFGDFVFFTEDLIKEFLFESRKKSCITVCALKSGTTTLRSVIPVQQVKKNDYHIEYELYYYPAEKFRTEKVAIIIDPDSFSEGLSLPAHFCGDKNYLIPFTTKLILHVKHWSNIWAGNVIIALSGIAKLKHASVSEKIRYILKARSFNKYTILQKANNIGKNCDIHPTACVEASTLGDNVSIGAGAIVRCANIGSNVSLGNNVVIEASTLGENSTILHGHIMFSICYPELLSVSQMISASLIGRKSFIGSGVTLTDYRLDKKNISIDHDGIMIDSENRLMGSCIGHNVYLGSGCIIAPGRAVPNGMCIAPPVEKVITSMEHFNDFRIVEH